MVQAPDFCMPLLVRHCARERVCGTLTISRSDDPNAIKTFLVDDGAIIFATSSSLDERLGERMVAWGVIDRDGLHRALERARTTDEVLGRALVGLGLLSEGDVQRSVERVIVEQACEPFHWSSADAFFEEKSGPAAGLAAGIPGEALQFAGIRSVRSVARVRAWVGNSDEVLVPVPDPFSVLAKVNLLPEEAFLISRLEGPMSVDAIVALWGMEEIIALRLLCALRFCDLLVPIDRSSGAHSWIGDRVLFSEFVAKRYTLTSDTSADTVDATDAARVSYLVEEKLHSLDGTDYYALLEVERRAPIERIKSSYRELAKTFHPDRHAQLAAFDGNIKKHLGTIFDALTKAYGTLTNPVEREAYDRKLADRDQREARPAPDMSRPTHAPAPKTRPEVAAERPEAFAPLSPPVTAPRARATEAPTAPPPTRGPVPQAPRSGRPAPRDIAQPARPTAQVAEALPPTPIHLTADEWFERGVAFAEAGNHGQAMRALRRGVEIAPADARLHAALGRTLTAMGGVYRNEAEKVLRRAVELAPDYIEGYLELGKLYKASGRRDLAREQYMRVLNVNPDEEEALAEVNGLGKPKTEAKWRFSFPSRGKK